jgi:hypothetical protein
MGTLDERCGSHGGKADVIVEPLKVEFVGITAVLIAQPIEYIAPPPHSEHQPSFKPVPGGSSPNTP